MAPFSDVVRSCRPQDLEEGQTVPRKARLTGISLYGRHLNHSLSQQEHEFEVCCQRFVTLPFMTGSPVYRKTSLPTISLGSVDGRLVLRDPDRCSFLIKLVLECCIHFLIELT